MKTNIDVFYNGYYPKSWRWMSCSWITIVFTVAGAKILNALNYVKLIAVDETCNSTTIITKVRTRPIITISNHASLCDPFVIAGTFVRWRHFSDVIKWIPWMPGAKSVAHKNRLSSLHMRLVKSLPLDRNEGVFQPTMDTMVNVLNNNNWVHIYPEGKIRRKKERLPYKKGIGRLITEPDVQPIVIPIYLAGTDDVVPMTRPFYPRFGKRVTVVVGKPVEFSEKVAETIKARNANKDTWVKIAEELQYCMEDLQEKAEAIHTGQCCTIHDE